MEFPGGIEEIAYGNSRGQLKKVELLMVTKKQSRGISVGLDFWPWNF